MSRVIAAREKRSAGASFGIVGVVEVEVGLEGVGVERVEWGVGGR